MLLIRFRPKHNGFGYRIGLTTKERVIEVPASGDSTMRKFLSAKGMALAELAAFGQAEFEAGKGVALETVDLGPPIDGPDKIVCLGLNYYDHARDAKLAIPRQPDLFAKFRNSLIGPFEDIVAPPAASAKVDYEGELAVVIGQRASRVSSVAALNYVAGYSAFNDVSARDLQMDTSQATAGKAIDTFAPLGPGIALAADVGDPQQLRLRTRVNGIAVQDQSTSQMIFPVAAIISYVSSFMTLEPGDVIATGTPSGVGFTRDPPVFLKDGDVVEVEIEKIGTLRNRVLLSKC